MGKIHVLSEQVANKIAAGEVIERPASIVKELIENALDAGADSIEIAVKNGGKSFIRVSDNGTGMMSEDAQLAFVRHATSKIASAEDLTRINSYGFRGEALPSIASVSRTSLITCAEGESAGTEIVMEGGKLLYSKGSAPRKGTLIEIRDLFFNTPARRKFLKTDSTEMGHVLDTVSNLAISKRQVRFSLESGGKKILDILPDLKVLDRAASILGTETARHLLEVDSSAAGIRIFGVIGKPSMARANRTGQIVFVNGRWVKALSLGYALQDGYHGLLMHGQYPVAILFVEVDLEKVDVNVHPTKQEVKISNEAEIKSFLRKIVAERLLKEGDLAPSLKVKMGLAVSKASDSPEFYSVSAPSQVETASIAEMPVFHSVEEVPALENLILIRGQLKITKVLGQIHNTFLVAETEEGLIIIDQHAAHERVMFEALLKNFDSAEAERQVLLMEEILEVHPRQRQMLEQSLPMLSKVGFEIEPFGDNDFIIRAYPAIFKEENPAGILKTFLEEREEGRLDTQLENQNKEISALLACKRKSVKAYEVLDMSALKTLLERLSRCENPFNCPHGRPTFIKLTFPDLERQFKRKA